MSEALHLCSVLLHPKSQYNPKHTRSVYFDTESRRYIARATVGTELIVEVEGVNNIDAEMKLSIRLDPIFRALRAEATMSLSKLVLLSQEPPLDDPVSFNRFTPSPDKPFCATPGAIDEFGHVAIAACLLILQKKATQHGGIDYLQVFETPDGARLWFIEDGEGGAITALLPEEY